MIEAQPYESRSHWYILLLALMINMLIIMLLFYLDYYTQSPTFSMATPEAPIVFESFDKPQPEQPEFQQEQIAALKPRASVFGATEIQQEEAEFRPGVTDSMVNSEDGTGIDQECQIQQQAEQVTEEQHNKANNLAEQTIKKILDAIPQESIEQDGYASAGETTESNTEQTAEDAAKNENKIADHLSRTALQQVKQKKLATKHNTGSGTKDAGPIKKTMTFADLARGFIESYKNEGQDWLERQGDENIQPQQQELKYLSYLQRICWYIQSTIKQHRIVLPPHWHPPLKTDMLLTFNREGTIENIQIISSSGCLEYDEYCLTVFYNNKTGYPPVPQHISENFINMPVSIILPAENARIRFSYQ